MEYLLSQPQNGWAEQRPEDGWEAAEQGIQRVLSKRGVGADEISGVGLSGQMHGLVMLDGTGEVLRPAILWCDGRTGEEYAEITERMGKQRLIQITANPALTGFTTGKILWVRRDPPEIYEKCRHILLPKGYLRYKLTGEFATEVSDASGMNLLDVPNRCWSGEVLERLDIDPAMLGRMAEQSPVDSNRRIYLPYLMGERSPLLDEKARGAFVGLSAMHSQGDLIRAAMEGPALGAAILAGVCAGVYDDVASAADAIVRPGQCCAQSDLSACYEPFYQLYTSLYPALKASFYFCGTLIMRFLSPALYRRMGVSHFYRGSLLVSGGLFLAFLLLPLPNFWAWILIGGVGLLQGATVPSLVILCCDAFPTRTVSASSIVVFGVSLAAMTAPVVMGAAMTAWGYQATMLLSTGGLPFAVLFLPGKEKARP